MLKGRSRGGVYLWRAGSEWSREMIAAADQAAGSGRSHRHCIHAHILFRITLVHVLEEDRAFLLVGGLIVGAGKAGVE